MKISCFLIVIFFITFLPVNAQLFGGQIKPNNSLLYKYTTGSVFCKGPTAIVDYTNPTTGKIWMDRNLGASRAATGGSDSENDIHAFGDLYQWGRGNDGHQCRNSASTTTLSSSDQPGTNLFIQVSGVQNDWRNPTNDNLWQGVNGINNPCPYGYRIPTIQELELEANTWLNLNSPFKPTLGGSRRDDGNTSIRTVYWSSTIRANYLQAMTIDSSNPLYDVNDENRSRGFSVRCIKEIIGSIAALNCGSTTIVGNLISETAATGVSASVPYTGGNSGYYAAQKVYSTGVTGLIATISQGLFANGGGNLIYTITGTPISSGTASFAINIGGQTCTLDLTVEVNLIAQYSAGSVFCASGPTAIVDVTNPNTGKIWMDRNLGATRVATSTTDATAYGDIYQWGRGNDGHQCRNSATTTTLSASDQPGNGNFIIITNNPYDWRSTENNNLWQGINGINNPCPNGYRIPTENELSQERSSWSSNDSFGAFNSQLKLSMTGYRNVATGVLTLVNERGYYWSSNINGTSSRNLIFSSTQNAWHADDIRASGESVRCIKDASTIIGTIANINCGSATNTGTLSQDSLASGVNSSIPYTGGNGGSHTGQTVNSTGVSGLTATLSSGIFAYGSGSLVYTISGIPSTSGTASFVINIGNQTCTLNLTVGGSLITQYAAGSVFCASVPTAIVDVTNPTTGKTWMDRNLGATRVAISSADVLSYGDLFQWGRKNDDHQCRNSGTTNILNNFYQQSLNLFIVSPGNWLNVQKNDLWQGVNGLNNICPNGYRIPTSAEFELERLSWNTNDSNGAFNSPLKLPVGGRRIYLNGNLDAVGYLGMYWTSNLNTDLNYIKILQFWPGGSYLDNSPRSEGNSVRCIKD